MSANETVLRDHQCKEKNIYKKNENIYAYICEDEEEEREFKNLHCTNGMQMQQKNSANAKRRQRREIKFEIVCGALQNLR